MILCDGKWEEHVTLYEDEEIMKELGKTVGEGYYPLADFPEIQKEFLKKLDEEASKKSAAEANDQSPTKTVSDVAKLEADMSVVSLKEGREQWEGKWTTHHHNHCEPRARKFQKSAHTQIARV